MNINIYQSLFVAIYTILGSLNRMTLLDRYKVVCRTEFFTLYIYEHVIIISASG